LIDWLEELYIFSGYSTNYVISSTHAILVPASLDMSASAPLLCAGITTYSPLKYYNLDKPGMKLGVVGLGGLGELIDYFFYYTWKFDLRFLMMLNSFN
jgi:D-arabinose 1-dehydrogenase-like Zn-dependent alcohol dehydrogenase